MPPKHNFFHLLSAGLLLAIFVFAACYFLPWENVNWGKLQLASVKTITVIGEAKTQQRNQIANFTAGVTSIKDNKDDAINEVNSKIETIIASVKTFGIKAEDIQTQNLSVYQEEETYYEEGTQKRRPGQWRVNNSIQVTLRDIDHASELANLLSRSGATNVYGPNFQLEETQAAEESLLAEAIENARKKAQEIAQSSGGTLGKIISITEGYQQPVTFRSLEGIGGGGPPVEPGTSTVQKTVTVVFELK